MSSPAAAAAGPLPVGFRFRPTDEELVRHYLKAKIAGRAHPDLLLIPDVDLSACEPWELPAKALIRSDDPEWFFFAPLDRKYPGGHRSNRSTAAGYWKATGKDRLIRSRPAGTLIGIKKTLVFHRGRAPRGHRTAWIMHEYRTAEPQFQQGQNGSFVLYRLFNKHEEEASTPPGSNSEYADSPSTSSPGNPQHVQAPELKAKNLTQTASSETARLTTFDNKEPTAAQDDDPLLDVLAQLPDLQPEQKCNRFPAITSPMRPYTDHPFVGDVGGQDLSAYINSIIAHQDLEDLLLSPALAKADEHPTRNTDPNPTALLMPSNSSNSKRLPETDLGKTDEKVLLMEGADSMGVARCSSATKRLQMDTSDVNNITGAQTNFAYSASAQVSDLYNQYQIESASIHEIEPPNSRALCSAGSWTPHPQHLFSNLVEPSMSRSDITNSSALNGLEGWAAEPTMHQFTHPQHLFSNMVEPSMSRSDMTNSGALNGLEGWAAEPTMHQFTVSNFMDQQGTAARRMRLVQSVQRASVTAPVLTSHLESEDEARSCYSKGSSSTNDNKDYAYVISQTMAGEAMHIHGGELVPTQVVSSVEVTGKFQDLSFDEDISPHPKLPHEANVKQRLKRQEYTKSSQNIHEGLQHGGRVPGEPSLRTRRQPARIVSVVQLLCLTLVVVLALVGVCKSSLCKSLNW